MIERKFVDEKIKEFQVQEFVESTLSNAGHSHTKLVRTPLGEKIVIFASRPGLVVGRKGENIKKLTLTLKKKFKLENPQIEISEVENPNLDSQIVAERIASTLERFGTQRFKGVGHKTMSDVMAAGALGVEIIISGKVPSSRAKSWRFYEGYLKKCGDVALRVSKACTKAKLKTGVVGIKVSIMSPDIKLPDKIYITGDSAEDEKEGAEESEEKTGEKAETKEKAEKKAEDKPKKKKTRKSRKKKAEKKPEPKIEKKESKEETKAVEEAKEAPETKVEETPKVEEKTAKEEKPAEEKAEPIAEQKEKAAKETEEK